MRTNSVWKMRFATIGVVVAMLAASLLAQQASKHLLSGDELKKVVPAEYFYRGQKAPVQLRNAVGWQQADGRMFLAALVDTSGYATAIQQKYQGLLITEVKLNVGGIGAGTGTIRFRIHRRGKIHGDECRK